MLAFLPRQCSVMVAAMCLLAGLVAPLWARGDVVSNPDANTLWIEDFDPFESSADSRSGWFAFEPEEIRVEQVTGRVRLREVSEYAGGSIQRILPLAPPDYRYLQIRVTSVDNLSHYFKAWLRLPGRGYPQLGRLPVGVCTVDLGAFPFFAELREMPLDLAIIGPTGRTPSGAVEVDWVRLVKSPVGGLTVGLIDKGEANRVAEIGDSIVFTYTSDQALDQPLEVTCRLASDRSLVRFDSRDCVVLADEGQNGDATAGDGIHTARATITSDATEVTGRMGTVVATTKAAGEPRNASALFALQILPRAWRAAEAASGIGLGEEILRGDFAVSDAHNWRAYDDGWTVYRPKQAGPGAGARETAGLRSFTYDRPRPQGRWISLPLRAREDASLSAGLRPLGGAGSIMLALRFTDPENHYRLRIDRASSIAIDRVCAGWQESLASTRLKDRIATGLARPASVATFTVAGSTLVASIDGRPVLHAHDNTFRHGRAALGLNRLNGQFENVMLRSATLTRPPAEFPWSGVRIRLELRAHDRAFGRDAGTIAVPVVIENQTRRSLGRMAVDGVLISRSIHKCPFAAIAVPELTPESSARFRIRLDAQRYRAGDYWLVVRLRAGGEAVATDAVRLVIGKPIPPERMDVFWWGGANIAEEIRAVAGAGVTVMHEFGRRSPELWTLGCRLGLTYYSYPPSVASAPARLKGAFENPKAGAHAVRVDELDPAFRDWAIKTAQSHARAWRSTRRLRYMLLNTEIETLVCPNLSEAAQARYRERVGFPRA